MDPHPQSFIEAYRRDGYAFPVRALSTAEAAGYRQQRLGAVVGQGPKSQTEPRGEDHGMGGFHGLVRHGGIVRFSAGTATSSQFFNGASAGWPTERSRRRHTRGMCLR